MNPVMLPRASVTDSRASRSVFLRSIPMSATPIAMLNTTTDGTTEAAREWNGFAGMNSDKKSGGSPGCIMLVLKNDAVVQFGNAIGTSSTEVSVIPQKISRNPPARLARDRASAAVSFPSPAISDTAT